MFKFSRWLLLTLTVATGFVACGADDSATKASPDTVAVDAAVSDSAVADTAAGDVDAGNTGAGDGGVRSQDASGGLDGGPTDTGGVAPDVIEQADGLGADVPVQPDVAADDGGHTDAAAPGVVCAGKNPAFPTFSKACTVDADCAPVQHQINCCGTQIALSIAKTEVAAFTAAESTCLGQYPQCGCASLPTVAEDGLLAFAKSDVKAVCKAGVCLATVPSGAGKCKANGAAQPQPFKLCQSNKDCTYMLHQVDCCGSNAAWGVAKTSKDAIAPNEYACAKLFPQCKCLAKPVTTEDGDNASSGLIAVACDQGACQTYIKY